VADFSDIRRALERQLAGISGIPQIAYENTVYNPEAQTSYVRCMLEVTTQRPAAVGVGVETRHSGLFLVDCFVRADDTQGGPLAADVLAEKVMDGFTYGQVLTENSKRIVIRFSERRGGRNDPPWYFVPVTIEWYCYF